MLVELSGLSAASNISCLALLCAILYYCLPARVDCCTLLTVLGAHSALGARCSLLSAGCSLLTNYWVLTHYWVLTARCWVLTNYWVPSQSPEALGRIPLVCRSLVENSPRESGISVNTAAAGAPAAPSAAILSTPKSAVDFRIGKAGSFL